MPVSKDKHRGTWTARVYTLDPVSGKRSEKKKRGFRTKEDAKKWEALQKISPDAVPCLLTFRQLDEEWIQYKSVNEDTEKLERTRVSRYMAAFADKPAAKITKAEILRWYLWLSALDLSPAVKNYCIGIVRSVFSFGASFYDMKNPALGLKKIRQDQRKEMNVWTPDQFSAFLSCVPPGPYRDYFFFVYWTGTRRCEALAVCASDIDPASQQVRIWHQIKSPERGFQPLKTEASARVLTMADPLWAYLRPVWEACTEERPFLFGGVRPLVITNIDRALADGIAASGLPAIRLHDFRHSWASNAIASGANIVAVSRYLGHSTVRRTLDTYTHLLEKTESDLVSRMAGLM